MAPCIYIFKEYFWSLTIFITFGDNFKWQIVKNYILLTILSFILPLVCEAQKITLGSCETKDGGLYQGEMVSGKPHGKGRTEYKTAIHTKALM